MIVRVAPHLAPPLPQRRAPEPVVGELMDDRVAHAPPVRPVRIVNDLERASNGRGSQLKVDRPASRHVYRSSAGAGASARRITVVNLRQVQSMLARSTRAAAALGVFGSARVFFGALDLYVAPRNHVDTGSPTSA